MGTLEKLSDATRHQLSARDLVGRSRHCDLRLETRRASGEHAVVQWTSEGWRLRDLGARNGTHVDGRRVEVGASAALAQGAEVSFGDDERWRLVDATPPDAMARSTAGGYVVCAEEGLLTLPGAGATALKVYPSLDGGWLLQRDVEARFVEDRTTVAVGGVTWILCLPETLGATLADINERAPPRDSFGLVFRVSRDGEHVELVVTVEGREIDLGARAHHHPLLLLARARRADAQSPELPPTSRGWMFQDELARMLAIDEGRLNVDVFRARKQLAKADVPNAASIVERRPGTRQLRIGTDQIEEVKL